MDDILEEYLPSPEVRAKRYMERVPIIGQPFPYNSEVCELPAEMMFMHEVIYGQEEKVDNVEVWEQIKEVTPELDKMWDMVKDLRARVEKLEKQNDLG